MIANIIALVLTLISVGSGQIGIEDEEGSGDFQDITQVPNSYEDERILFGDPGSYNLETTTQDPDSGPPYSHLFKIKKARFAGCIGTKPWYCYQVWVPYDLIIHQSHFTITETVIGIPIDVTYELSRKWELKGVWFKDYKVTYTKGMQHL
jgi:hypothetical protein